MAEPENYYIVFPMGNRCLVRGYYDPSSDTVRAYDSGYVHGDRPGCSLHSSLEDAKARQRKNIENVIFLLQKNADPADPTRMVALIASFERDLANV